MAAALLRISRRAQSLFSERPAVLCRTVHTWVWWDFNTCEAPLDSDVPIVAGNITAALAKLNYSAPLTFSIYGNTARTWFGDDESPEALSEKGFKVFLEFSRRENISSKRILHDIWMWTKDHPAPANCLIISGDEDLSFALHQLGMRRYNVLLAKPRKRLFNKHLVKPRAQKGLGEMETAAKVVWEWTSLAAGGPPERTSQ